MADVSVADVSAVMDEADMADGESWNPWRQWKQWRKAKTRWTVGFYDGCMGPETRKTCSLCGSQVVQSHVARSAGFKGEFGAYWLPAQKPCEFCEEEHA